MLYYIQSNKLEILSEKLAQLLALPSNQNLLTQDQVLVQSPGMSTWLKLEIAKHNGIAAGQTFPLPSNFTWELCYALLPNVPAQNPFTKQAMTWKLMTLLPTVIEEEKFTTLKQYLAPKHQAKTKTQAFGLAQQKLYQLAAQIADIYDQYLIYRPDWILAWESNHSALQLKPEQEWQPILWRKLVHYNQQELGQSNFHRANLHQNLIQALQSPENSHKLPERLYIFGLSALAPQMLEILRALAQQIDIFMLGLSPCQHYWGDIVEPKTRARMAVHYKDKKQLAEGWEESLEVGNALLANNGKTGRELLDMLLEIDADEIQIYDAFSAPSSNSLLHGIQQDILDLTTLDQSLRPELGLYLNLEDKRILAADDQSLTIKSCHSALREVETLHDHLLLQLKNNPSLQAKDIVVMMPDVASYAPYIDAVFGSQRNEHFIPYAIADRGASQESPLINSFLQLLNLDRSRFPLTEITACLEVPAIMARFDLDEDEVMQIKQWLIQAKVRWGRNAQHSQELGLVAQDKHSWAFGIRRMCLGYALGDEAELYQQDLPLSGIEGQKALALGKLLNFIEVLDSFALALQAQDQITNKVLLLQELVNHCYLAEEATDLSRNDLNEIRQAIDDFANELTQANYQSVISQTIVRQWFQQKLAESRVGQRYLAGAVNFCTLMPMRSIPFKVVALLGMNQGIYPRVQYPVGFDLMAHYPARKGDRSRRHEDRYLFLEALLSAREQLYLSFIGHSERDNNERLPSMVISELIEYCQLCYRHQEFALPEGYQNLTIEEKAKLEQQSAAHLAHHFIQEMPLQPFDPRLFREQGTYQQSFSKQWCPAQAQTHFNTPQRFGEQALPVEPWVTTTEGNTELQLSTLIRFYRNPAEYFFHRTLKVNFELYLIKLENNEPFTSDGLENYLLDAALIDDALTRKNLRPDTQFIEKLRATGQLPMKPFDSLLIQERSDKLQVLLYNLLMAKQHLITRAQPIELTLMVADQPVTLTGRIDHYSPKGLLDYRPSTAKAKDLIRLYINHLSLNAAGYHQHAFLLDSKNFHALAPIDAEQAKALLVDLISLFIAGNQQPLCFLPKLSQEYLTQLESAAPKEDGTPDFDQIFGELESTWFGFHANTGEASNPYYRRAFRFPEDFLSDELLGFKALAHRIYDPLNSLSEKATLAKFKKYFTEALKKEAQA